MLTKNRTPVNLNPDPQPLRQAPARFPDEATMPVDNYRAAHVYSQHGEVRSRITRIDGSVPVASETLAFSWGGSGDGMAISCR